ncbi:MAG: alanine racemase [Methylophilaceae bacterium]|nr:MAG: alanine racemase [Methylophilaceae bacterium]
MRPIQATVSTSALQHNLNIVRQHAQAAKVMSVVKANGYGHGLMNVAHALANTDAFATLNLSEAIDLREAGFEQDILLLEGAFDEEELRIAASFKISVVVHSAIQANLLQSITLSRPVNIYLKMNTGMNRLGFRPCDYLSIYQQLNDCKNVRHITLMTHFATADEEQGIAEPLTRFKETIKSLNAPVSLANSATILRYPEAHANWVRPGIMLYGATPVSGTPATAYDLKPVMQLSAKIIAIQTLAIGESVGYGARFTATKETRIGVVACGYADGYPRHAPNGTPIAVNGRLTQTLGRVSMDMLFCDLTDMPEADIGAHVELWGTTVPVDAVAEASGTVGYELLCAVAPRVPIMVVA